MIKRNVKIALVVSSQHLGVLGMKLFREKPKFFLKFY